uniref:Rhomboid domain-containing protein n=1 Tax=Strongyloides papillosus TaxID=174720 RepID=A0A0N5CIV1_STREA
MQLNTTSVNYTDYETQFVKNFTHRRKHFLDNPDKTHDLCLLPRAIFNKKQWYKILLPILMHGDDPHLYYNMVSFMYKGKRLERLLGSLRFLSILITFIIATPLVHILLSYAGDEFFDMGRFMRECIVGFSVCDS